MVSRPFVQDTHLHDFEVLSRGINAPSVALNAEMLKSSEVKFWARLKEPEVYAMPTPAQHVLHSPLLPVVARAASLKKFDHHIQSNWQPMP